MMKSTQKLLSAVIALGIFSFVFIIFPQTVDASGKNTKVSNGDYIIVCDYYDTNPAQIDGIKGKISSEYFTLSALVENLDTDQLLQTKSVKVKLAKNCKFYTYPIHTSKANGIYSLNRISKKTAAKLMNNNQGQKLYNCFNRFHVKNNKVDMLVIGRYCK